VVASNDRGNCQKPAIASTHVTATSCVSSSVVCSSRTAFAERFREVVGQTPLDYLAGWRMRLAADRLRRSSDSIASIGFSVGYESEAAFSTAFRRLIGCTPMQHRRMLSA
jgi:AraC-like DNA-binding protein